MVKVLKEKKNEIGPRPYIYVLIRYTEKITNNEKEKFYRILLELSIKNCDVA